MAMINDMNSSTFNRNLQERIKRIEKNILKLNDYMEEKERLDKLQKARTPSEFYKKVLHLNNTIETNMAKAKSDIQNIINTLEDK